MWQHVYGGEDEGTTEEEMTSSANRRPEAGSESEAGGCGLEEEAIHDRTMTVASPVHRLQAVSEPVLSVVDYTDDILQHAKSREVIRLFSTPFSASMCRLFWVLSPSFELLYLRPGIFLNTSLERGRVSKLRELEFFP